MGDVIAALAAKQPHIPYRLVLKTDMMASLMIPLMIPLMISVVGCYSYLLCLSQPRLITFFICSIFFSRINSQTPYPTPLTPHPTHPTPHTPTPDPPHPTPHTPHPTPHRNSKLTFLLQDYLREHSRVIMMANVSPLPGAGGGASAESRSSLEFAARCRSVALGPSRLSIAFAAVEGGGKGGR